MKQKIIILILFIIIFSSLVSGCGVNIDSEVYGEDEVMEYVAECVPNENYELVSVEEMCEKPQNVEYTFKSLDRDITFTANSYIATITFEWTYYKKEISCSYDNAVWAIYRERFFDELEESSLWDGSEYIPEMYLMSFADIDTVADSIYAASDILKEELQYNDEDYIKKYLYQYIHIYWVQDEEAVADWEAGTYCFITTIKADGFITREEIYEQIADAYSQEAKNLNVKNDDDIPEIYFQDKHNYKLNTIYLNNEEMTYEEVSNPFNDGEPVTSYFKYSLYNSELESYMMYVDTGHYDSWKAALIIPEYVEALNGTWENLENGASWQIGGDEWILTCEYSSDSTGEYVSDISIKKNGKELQLDCFLETGDEINSVRTYKIVYLSIDDFAKLFNLSYKIDEENDSISFYSIF